MALPPIPLETQDLVRRALAVAISHKMTEAQVKAFVAWIKEGHQPEDYGIKGGEVQPQAGQPRAETTSSLAQPVPRSRLSSDLSGVALAKPEASAKEDGAGGAGNILWTKIKHIPSHVLNRVFPRSGRLLHLMAAGMGKMGVKNKFWAYAISLFLVLWVGSFLIGQATRHLTRTVSHIIYSRAPVSDQRESNPPVAQSAPLTLRYEKQVSRPKANKPKTVAAKAPAAKAPVVQPQAVSPQLEAWAASDVPLAGEFANRFYGVSYMNWDGTMDYFKAHMTEDESPVFIQQYFPPTLLRQFQEKRLVLFFEASKPPQLVKVEGTKDEFLAQGTVTTKSYLNRNPQTLSKKPVALMVEIWHVQGFGARVGKAAEVSPDEAKALSQNAPIVPVGNPKDSSQRDQTDQVGKIIGNAANAAATAAAGDAVSQTLKKLLPF